MAAIADLGERVLKSRSEIVAIVGRCVEALSRQGIQVEQSYLFGSYLQGKASEHSDIDLVLVSPNFVGMQPWKRLAVTGRARHAVFQSGAPVMGESVEGLAKTPEEMANRHPASFLAGVLKDDEIVCEGRRAR